LSTNVFATPIYSAGAWNWRGMLCIYSATKHIERAGRALGGVDPWPPPRQYIRGVVEPYMETYRRFR